jgi:hypothetical protein
MVVVEALVEALVEAKEKFTPATHLCGTEIVG